MKQSFKFEVSFNLHTDKGEKLDRDSIRIFQDNLRQFVTNYAGDVGSFYAYAKAYDTEVFPTSIKIKQSTK